MSRDKVVFMRNYLKKEDGILLPMIRNIIEIRPIYGYKRITAMVNNIFHGNTRKVNKKRIYRIRGVPIRRSKTNAK